MMSDEGSLTATGEKRTKTRKHDHPKKKRQARGRDGGTHDDGPSQREMLARWLLMRDD